MKQMAIEKLAGNIEKLVEVAPTERILLTRNGKPFAFVTNAGNYDWEDIGTINDPDFWKMISESRKQRGGIPLEQVKAQLLRKENEERESGTRRKPARKARTKQSHSIA
jgi:hypothetical protein